MKFGTRQIWELSFLGFLGGFLLVCLGGTNPTVAATPPTHVIVVDKARLEIGDGDTIIYAFQKEDGVPSASSGKLRLLGYDTPETMSPEFGMFYSQVCGPEATRMTKKILLEEAEKIEIHTKLQLDQYKRLLAYIVYYDKKHTQKLLAVEMINRGLAFESIYQYGDNGFPQFYSLVDAAWKESPNYKLIQRKMPPYFLAPYLWRKLNLRHDLAIVGYDSWSDEQKQAWLRDELSKNKDEAERRAEVTRLELVQKAEQRRNQMELFYLRDVYGQFTADCRVGI